MTSRSSSIVTEHFILSPSFPPLMVARNMTTGGCRTMRSRPWRRTQAPWTSCPAGPTVKEDPRPGPSTGAHTSRETRRLQGPSAAERPDRAPVSSVRPRPGRRAVCAPQRLHSEFHGIEVSVASPAPCALVSGTAAGTEAASLAVKCGRVLSMTAVALYS